MSSGFAAGLPAPVRRHLDVAGAAAPVDSVTFAGRGAIRQQVAGSYGVWVPLTWDAELLPARAFVWKARVRVAGVPLRRVSDEFRSDRGRFVAGRRVLSGDAIDRAEYTMLWAWTLLLAPREGLTRAGAFCEAVDETTARLDYPFRGETWECTLRFDSASGLLSRLDTHRVDIRTGHPQRWSAEVGRWAASDGHAYPAAVLTRWSGDPAVRLEVERVAATAR